MILVAECIHPKTIESVIRLLNAGNISTVFVSVPLYVGSMSHNLKENISLSYVLEETFLPESLSSWLIKATDFKGEKKTEQITLTEKNVINFSLMQRVVSRIIKITHRIDLNLCIPVLPQRVAILLSCKTPK